MAFDENLADRIRTVLANRGDVVEKKMFGGLCFMVAGHMCCGVVGDELMARVGPDQYEDCLKIEHAREMDFTKKPMKGMVYVAAVGIDDAEDLSAWVERCLRFVETLPSRS